MNSDITAATPDPPVRFTVHLRTGDDIDPPTPLGAASMRSEA